MGDRFLTTGTVEHAVEKPDLLLLLVEEMIEFEPIEIFVFEICERVQEDDRAAVAVAVEQSEAALRLQPKRGLDQRQHRSDPRPARNPDQMARVRGIELSGEAAMW